MKKLEIKSNRTVLLSSLLLVILAMVFVVYGPIPQLSDYHNFADKKNFASIPNFADVFSNIGFLLSGIYGLIFWKGTSPGYRLFLFGLILTGLGSSYYHWSPDNARLVWDRLPISLVCAGLLVGAYYESKHGKYQSIATLCAALFAGFGVWWWVFTEQASATPHQGDLRPYLYLQLLPLLLIPLWHYLEKAPARTKKIFGAAILFYAIAKVFELVDHQTFAVVKVFSGHTLKHIFATFGGACIVWHLVRDQKIEAK